MKTHNKILQVQSRLQLVVDHGYHDGGSPTGALPARGQQGGLTSVFRILTAPDFQITAAEPDFPPALLETLKTARDVTGANYVSFWANVSDVDLAATIAVTTFPAAWLRRYRQMDYSLIDPMIQTGLNSVGAVILDHEHGDTAEIAAFGADAMNHDLGRYTIGIPVHVGARIHSVTTFTTDLDVRDSVDSSAMIARCREQAQIVALAVVERFLKVDAPSVDLTAREIEVLYWGAQGNTDQKTGEIMDISRWTVVAHVQSAKTKLRVKNKAAAIARALELNLFSKFDHKL